MIAPSEQVAEADRPKEPNCQIKLLFFGNRLKR